MQHGPLAAIGHLHSGPEHGVEVDVIFAHELVKLDVLGRSPPFLPLVGVRRCYRRVTDRCVHPDVHDFTLHRLVLFFVTRLGYGYTPSQVSCDRGGSKTTFHPWFHDLTVGEDDGIAVPFSLDSGRLEPFFKSGLECIQPDAGVCRWLLSHRVVLITLASRIEQLDGRRECSSALITLISTRIIVATSRASPLYESISQEPLFVLTESLLRGCLLKEPVLSDIEINVLHELGLFIRRRPPKVIETDVEPLIRLGMKLVELVTELSRSHTFLQSLCLCRCSVFVRATDEESWDVEGSRVSSKDVGRESRTNDVSQVRDIVHVWEG